MINALLWLLAVVSFGVSPLAFQAVQDKVTQPGYGLMSQIPAVYPQIDTDEIKNIIRDQAPTLNEAVMNKALTALKCAIAYNVEHTNILTVIDYSLPANEKRLWVFDLSQKKLLFHTYVAHGIKSGTLLTNFFSNKYNSKASSIGIYKTEKSYYGREGLSLRLEGLDRNFNDNASNRSIVMHGGWYMEENFIKKYGRPGRSWGCPALPLSMYQPIINAIKDSSLIVVYYPSDDWFAKSKFLTCSKKDYAQSHSAQSLHSSLATDTDEQRDDVLFAEVNKGGEDKPVLVMRADNYKNLFHAPAPLGRMLRRQINHEEYIAVSNSELNQLVAQHQQGGLYFVIPVLHMVRGYYETEMKIVNLGTIKDIHPDTGSSPLAKNYTINFEAQPTVRLKSTNRFIRWLGL